MSKAKPQDRCRWCGEDALYVAYHDQEWGVPLHDDQKLFEFLILEGAQAGLSWLTILKKRDAYRKAYYQFDVEKIARFNSHSIERLVNNPGIVRNRLKIEASIDTARAFLEIQDEFGSFDKFVWQYVDHQPRQNRWRRLKDIPVSTNESKQMSKDLQQRGFRFVGPTICYAFMQAVGMVNDHVTDCFRHKQVAKIK
ncbi:MAG: DNA-3-methyladenine glycosylase I [Halobacteria archaeon]|nr:DNA-3-methyladenine glycosylase I [Halobacteria archaeon]